ncbi:MAG: rRNA maturation RNase YbeY [Clostridia bacterium]|nr:rRNA maturation RNase YbeY [Clostridia bacterium]
MRIIFDNEKYEKQIKKIEKSASKVLSLPKKSYIELDFVEKEEIQEINKRTRGVDKITDVLSFPNLDLLPGEKIKIKDFPFDVDYDTGMLNLGSIVVCVDKILEQAKEYGTGENREFCYLLTHGICHVLGYDHMEEEDKAIMRQKEEEILKKAKV